MIAENGRLELIDRMAQFRALFTDLDVTDRKMFPTISRRQQQKLQPVKMGRRGSLRLPRLRPLEGLLAVGRGASDNASGPVRSARPAGVVFQGNGRRPISPCDATCGEGKDGSRPAPG